MGRFVIVVAVLCWSFCVGSVSGIGANWGTQASHPLSPSIVVEMLKDNGIQKVKLFGAEDGPLNDMLPDLAASMKAEEKWVSKNVSSYVNDGVKISYIAVGNEPFLKSYNGTYLQPTFPALQNIQSALIKAGPGNQVKATIPLNADVFNRVASLQMQTSGPTSKTSCSPLSSSSTTTLLLSLLTPIVIGEIGWPTDGDMNANVQYAQKFNQGLLNHISSGQGTPMRPGPIDAYFFSLIDEDEKSIQPGNFERHWGIFTFDGQAKYLLKLTNSGIIQAKGVKHLEEKWCVFKPSAGLDDLNVASSVSFACGNADCTSLGYKTSCGDLDVRGNISYAFNSYYQENDQDDRACGFSNLGTITNKDPSTQTCRFAVMIEVSLGVSWRLLRARGHGFAPVLSVFLRFLLTFL